MKDKWKVNRQRVDDVRTLNSQYMTIEQQTDNRQTANKKQMDNKKTTKRLQMDDKQNTNIQ